MKKSLILIAPLSVLALAACNKSQPQAADADAAKTAEAAAPAVPAGPQITASGSFTCADKSVVYVDFLGQNEAADIHVGDKAAAAVHVVAPKAGADGKPGVGPMKSEDGKTMLSGGSTQINLKLADKGAQSCKAS